ncbi:MAG: hypothetical protein AB7P18_17395 [Candidatus Binatia bacterium]
MQLSTSLQSGDSYLLAEQLRLSYANAKVAIVGTVSEFAEQ